MESEIAMATDVESGVHNQSSTDNSRLSWCFKNLFRFTFGSCYYSRDDSHSHTGGHELTDYTTEEREPLINRDSEWTTKIQQERADHRIKLRLQRHFQDHIQKWSRDKHPRFPWKAGLHLLLVVFVTAQVSY